MVLLKVFLFVALFIIGEFLTNSFPVDAQKLSTTSAAISSYELFWPVTSGKVLGEQFYFWKIIKETLKGFFIFNAYKKAEYNILLSEKRIVEAEKLLIDKKDYDNGSKTLQEAEFARNKVISYISQEREGRQSYEIKRITSDSLVRQKTLLNYLAYSVPEQQKLLVQEQVIKIDSILASLNP